MTNDDIHNLMRLVQEYGDVELTYYTQKLLAERKRLIEIAELDPLTGLLNRNVLPSVRDCNVAVMCDVDGFKEVNTEFGHDGGDNALKLVADTLKKSVRHCDYVIRYGGDEFLILFTGCSEQIVYDRMEEIRQKIENNGYYPITLSIGIATSKTEEKLEDVITKADKAVFCSKDNGKNCITCYDQIDLSYDKKKVKINTSM